MSLKFYRFLYLFSLLCTNAYSVYAQQITLKGYLGVEGGESYTYKLVFKDSSGYLSGHAYTYLHEGRDVKAAITGFIDRNNQTIFFKETGIVYNNGFESNTTICLIYATLKQTIGNNGQEVFKGAITSSDISNVYCGQGTVSFPVTENLRSIFTAGPAQKEVKTEPRIAPVKPSKPMKIVYDTAVKNTTVVRPVSAHEQERITAGTEKIIDWYSDTLIIEIWDGSTVDGDKLTIRYNDKTLAERYTLQKEHKIIREYPVAPGVNELVFTANSEGNQPPMTANVRLIDGNIRHDLLVYNKIGKTASIKIRKNRQ